LGSVVMDNSIVGRLLFFCLLDSSCTEKNFTHTQLFLGNTQDAGVAKLLESVRNQVYAKGARITEELCGTPRRKFCEMKYIAGYGPFSMHRIWIWRGCS